MAEKIEIIEEKKIGPGLDLILGIPDVGLVGTIAVTHLIDELGLKELGYLDSALFPPLTVVHEHVPKSPVRIYGDKKIIVLVSEMPIAPTIIYPFIDSLMAWFEKKKFNPTDVIVLSLSGRGDKDLNTYINYFKL